MPIGEPPTKPVEGASEAEYEKYRHDFNVYVEQKLAQFADTELSLKEEQKAVGERMEDLDGREKGIASKEKALATEKDKLDAREIVISHGEEDLRKDERGLYRQTEHLKNATG